MTKVYKIETYQPDGSTPCMIESIEHIPDEYSIVSYASLDIGSQLGTKFLCESLKSIPSHVKELWLNDNALYKKRKESLSQIFDAIPDHIESLNLDSNDIGFTMPGQAPILSFSCSFTDVFSKLHAGLKKLSLKNSKLNSTNIHLISGLPESLHTLDISDSNIHLITVASWIKLKGCANQIRFLYLSGYELDAFNSDQAKKNALQSVFPNALIAASIEEAFQIQVRTFLRAHDQQASFLELISLEMAELLLLWSRPSNISQDKAKIIIRSTYNALTMLYIQRIQKSAESFNQVLNAKVDDLNQEETSIREHVNTFILTNEEIITSINAFLVKSNGIINDATDSCLQNALNDVIKLSQVLLAKSHKTFDDNVKNLQKLLEKNSCDELLNRIKQVAQLHKFGNYNIPAETSENSADEYNYNCSIL